MGKKAVVTIVLAMLTACASSTSAVKPAATETPKSSQTADVAGSVKALCDDFVARDPSRWTLATEKKQAGSKVQEQFAITDKANGTLVQLIVYDAGEVSPALSAIFAYQLLQQNRMTLSKLVFSDEQGTMASFTVSGKAPDGHAFSGKVVTQFAGTGREKTVFMMALWPDAATKEMAAAVDGLALRISVIK